MIIRLPLPLLDANNEAGSSPAATDANAAPSGEATTSSTEATTDAKQTTEATPSETPKEPATLEEAIEQAGAKHREGTPKPEEKKPEETQTEAAPPKEENASEEEVPFHGHPRWQQVNNELKEAKPLAERTKNLDKYLADTGISQVQFEDMLKIGALMNSDPKKALEALKPYVEALESYQGLRLPDDLQKKVSEGVIDEETAKEVAALRAQRVAGEKNAQQREADKLTAEVNSALASWEDSIKKTDPDYAKKFDMVLDRYNRITQAHRGPRNAQNAVALAQQAYDEVNKQLGTFVPKPPAKKVLTSTGASTKTNSEPATIDEAMAQAAAKYRES